MSDAEENENGTRRIEAFSDGVFAIAITLPVLKIKVPHVSGNTPVADLYPSASETAGL